MNLDYNTRLAAIQRNEKLAQIMQQQAFQPIEINSYQGIQAPISPLSGLAKVLQAYMGARGTGDEERIKLNQEARAEAQQMLSGLQDRPASSGRAAVMGMPEIQAQPATSFTPMGSDFEDNPNLPVAPSGNVEVPAVAYQPAVAPQAAIAPQAAVQMTPELKRAKLVEIMMGQNPYASPVAKLMYESLEKENTGPLAEYRLYAQQAKDAGQTPLSIDAYKTRQILAGRAVSNNVVNMPAGAPIPVMRNGKQIFVQMGKDGKYVEVEGISPVQKETALREQLADAGIFPNNPDGTPNPEYLKYAQAQLRKNLSMTQAAGSITTEPGEKPPGFVPKTEAGETINPANIDAQGNLIVTATPGSATVAADRARIVTSAEAGGRVSGASEAQAAIDLPKVVDNSTTAIRHVNELVNHPGFKSSVGMGVPGMKYISGTKEADFRSRFSQVEGGSFLRAIDTLKGTGAITEVEGTKATTAVNRMSTATSEKEFRKAAQDYVDIIQQGVKQTYGRAKQNYVPVPNFEAEGQPKTVDYGRLK
jgi:hypothetical protein